MAVNEALARDRGIDLDDPGVRLRLLMLYRVAELNDANL